ncbi:MAG: ADP-ribosylglycohydrolase family protein [Myxococcales bacterium]|nr:ADP-ribosylglycohydrolase family protein [Myxococcales bacterium]
MSLTHAERVEGGLLGLLVGDALGVPYEFHRPENLPPREALEMVPPQGFPRAHRGVPAGTWSDDGALALALLDSLLTCGALDLDDFARRMLAWFEEGAYTADGRVFDVGVQTSRAFRAILGGASPEVSGPSAERENGNGSLMRVLPLALFHDGPLEELVTLAERQSLPTHGHWRSRVSCAFYCVWARHELSGHTDGFARAAADLRRMYADSAERLEVLEFHLRPEDESPGGGSGYVIDTLRSSRDVLREPSFEAVVKAAVALGHDTDTTACVAGGIAGIRHGVQGIPARFREALAGERVYRPLLDRLLARVRAT